MIMTPFRLRGAGSSRQLGCYRVSQRVGPVAVIWLLALACSNPAREVFEATLDDGRQVAELVRSSDERTSLLFYTAEACLVCGTALPRWLAASRDGQIKVVLIVAGEVSEEDRRILRVHRIPVIGFAQHQTLARTRLPAEYIIEDGRVSAHAEGYPEVRAKQLWRQASLGVD